LFPPRVQVGHKYVQCYAEGQAEAAKIIRFQNKPEKIRRN